jgi:hypothetical protein
MKDQILSKYRNDQCSSALSSARMENNASTTVELNKKLLLSGFFDDDYNGEIRNA